MKKILLSLLCLGLATGCQKDLLNSTPYGQLTSSQYWRNGNDVVAAANALYTPLLSEDGFVHTEWAFDNCSDDMNRAGDHADEGPLEQFTFDASNSKLLLTWSTKYEVISRANALLLNAPKVQMDKALQDRSLGEAYFLRGFVYWRLSLIYGEVPLLLEADALASNYNKPKASVADIRNQIEADWKKAAELLPATYDEANQGRVSQGTAYGFLAKLYVYQEKWDQAIEAGRKVTENQAYRLAADFGDNFRVATEHNPEILFGLEFSTGWTEDNWSTYYHTPQAFGGWGFHEPIQDLVDEFETGDPRLALSIFRPGDQVDRGAQGITTFTKTMTRVTGFAFRKYTNFTASGDMDQNLNAPLLRSADVYLLVSEAKIRSGKNGDAELNAVRKRAGLSAKTNATMKDIMHERRVELAGENERHQDLMRWDKAQLIDLVAHYKKDRGPYKPGRTFVRPKHYYFPLPQRQIDLSNGVLIQNSNY
ncbi:RagB/SusD family nutrient uptake outer membrane protein [Siphonobacter aquaeclarae]|uniref:Starch-binding associating with outer membrane n=1 Tax=Siphonobacter aquaeclarae TaxID=563176 RepID=A0A1G9LGG5_9BACT|nr:RagB/SusD family nutrient uptake outer membrane protein [Siphonobacter aquaeclarae]SDL61011.1 Starch-binding associating with outer membrane [Siphonobacter aquaeclarae]